MEIPLRYSIFFAGSHWKVDSSQGKPAPTSLLNLWACLDLGSGGLSCAPVWGWHSHLLQLLLCSPRSSSHGDAGWVATAHFHLPISTHCHPAWWLPCMGTDTCSDFPGEQNAPVLVAKCWCRSFVQLSKRVVLSPTDVPQTLSGVH